MEHLIMAFLLCHMCVHLTETAMMGQPSTRIGECQHGGILVNRSCVCPDGWRGTDCSCPKHLKTCLNRAPVDLSQTMLNKLRAFAPYMANNPLKLKKMSRKIQSVFRKIMPMMTDGDSSAKGVKKARLDDVYLLDGSALILTCLQNNKFQDSKIRWTFRRMDQHYSSILTNDPSIGLFILQDGRLDIQNATKADTGWYGCSASTSRGIIKLDRRVFVVEPSTYKKNVSEKVNVSIGDHIDIECKAATGLTYRHSISWSKKPGRIDFTSVHRKRNVLIIKRAKATDIGEYRCIVQSTIEGPKMYTMTLY